MQERRKSQRRDGEAISILPYHLSSGEVVETDRRHLPDRRLDNIAVEEISCEEFISELSRQD